MSNRPQVSIVIPVFDEEENIQPLYEEIKTSMQGINFEAVFVDDGSKDATFSELKKLASKDRRIIVAQHRRNFGQSQAWRTGFKLASGEVIVTMDGDLQNDPRDIPRMLQEINENTDIITGWRKNRQDNILKKIPSKISNWLAYKLTGLNIHDYGCSLKVYKRECVQNIDLRGEMHRYMLALLGFQGYKIKEMQVNHRQRHAGKSKYGFRRLLRGFLDLLFVKFNRDYYSRPLHFFGGLGISAIILSIIFLAYKLATTVLSNIPLEAGPLLVFSGILFVSGFQLVTLGFLAEIIIRIYDKQTNKENEIKTLIKR